VSKACVTCTFEFLISATPYLQPTTSGVSLGGLDGKTLTASAPGCTGKLDGIVQPRRAGRCTIFIFGSRICIANGLGGFNSHLANSRELEASTPTSSCDIDEHADNLGKIQISDLIGNWESKSGSSLAPTRDESGLESPFGFHNTATVYWELLQSESLSA
jgi:hypothetical protein